MALKITDLVDQSAINELEELKRKLEEVKRAYDEAARDLVNGLKVTVEVKGDLDKLNQVYAASAQKAAEATQKLNDVVRKQEELAGRTTAAISRKLDALNEEEKLTREKYQLDRQAQQIANDQLGTMQQNAIRMAEINAQLKQLSAEQKNYAKQLESGTISQSAYVAKMAAVEQKTMELKTAKSELQRVMSNDMKLNQAASGSYTQLSLQLERMKMAYKAMNDAEKQSTGGQQLGAAIKELDAALKEAAQDMGEFQRNTGNYAIAGEGMAQATVNAKTELKELINEVANLTLQYRAMSEEQKNSEEGMAMAAQIQESTQRASELRDAISDVRSEINQGASDTAGFDAISAGLQLITNGFGIAEGAANLLGISEKSLAQIQTNLQSVMVVSNGIIQVQNALQKQSALMKGVEIVQRGAAAAAIKLETAAQSENVIVTNLATAAQAAFNAVANANPYVLLATAILAAIGAIIAFTSATEESTAAQDANTEAAQRNAQIIQEANEKVSKSTADGAMKMITTYRKLQIEWGKLRTDMQKSKFIKDNADAIKGLTSSVNSIAEAEKFFHGNTGPVIKAFVNRAKAAAYTAAAADTYKEIILLQDKKADVRNMQAVRTHNDKGDLVIEWRTDPALDRQQEKLEKKAEEYLQKAIDLEIAADGILGSIKTATSGSGGSRSSSSGSRERNENKRTGSNKPDKPEKHENTEKPRPTGDIQLDLLNLQKQDLTTRLSNAEKFSDEWLKIKQDLINKELEINLKQLGKNYDARKKDIQTAIKDKKTQDAWLTQLETAFQSAKQAIIDNARYEKNKADEDVEADRIKKGILGIQNEMSARLSITTVEYNKEKQKLKQQYIEKLKAANANEKAIHDAKLEYERLNEEIDIKYASKSAEIQIQYIQKMLSESDLSEKEREDLEKQLSEAKAKLLEEEVKAVEDAEQRKADAAKEAADKEKEINDKRKKLLDDYIDKAKEALSEVFNLVSAIYDAQIQKIEDRQTATSEAYDKEVERIESMEERGAISSEEAEKRKTAAKKKSDKEDEALEKKKAKLKYQQAVWEKAASAANVAISTAQAIMAIWADASLLTYAKPAMTALAAGIGAVQLATILATPIPKYAKGTDYHKGGAAIVGDAGKEELVEFGDSFFLTPSKPTLVDLPRGAKVYPDAEDRLQFLDNMQSFGTVNDNQPTVVVNNDYKALERILLGISRQQKNKMRQERILANRMEFEAYKAARI